MESDTAVRRNRGYRAANNPSDRDEDSGFKSAGADQKTASSGSDDTKKKPVFGLCLLEESNGVVLLVFFLLALWGLVHLSLRQLVVGASTGEFNAVRARKHLEHITAFGPRPVGSPENEILTVNYLLEEIEKIKAGSNKAHTISVDVQKPTGSFTIDFLGGFTSYYDRVSNVVVKLEPKRGAKHAMLANCHFDSVANSPGASDDAVSCSVLLEALHSMSNLSTPLRHAIIFLFNGAEENVLQASHGFITQHPWAKLVRAFINLEAAGVGGKEIVFQTGPENPWLMQAYVRAVTHPFASVVGQEVFQSGVIPSDTDFRIYRDFGHIPGIDLAFIENGYLYHTKYDTADRILTDTIQRAGDNILAVLKLLASSEELANSSEYRHGNMVFFDVLGVFMVAYPARVGTIINYMVTVATLIYLGKKCSLPNNVGFMYMRSLACAIGVTLMSWFIAFVSVLIIAGLISLTGQSMFWYTHYYVSVCLYGTAGIAMLMLIHTLAKNHYCGNMNQLQVGEIYFDVTLTLWCCALVYLTQQGLCSAYVPMITVVFPLITKLLLRQELKQRGATFKYTSLYLLGLSLPYVHFMFLMWVVFEIFTPILGRSGTEIPPDVVLASITTVCVIILSSYFIHFIYLSKSMKRTLVVLASIFGVVAVLVSSGVFFPYSCNSARPRPKRIFLQHTTRTFHGLNGEVIKKDSGIWINGFDYTGMKYVTPHIPEINDTIRAPCDKQVPFCGFPWFLPVEFLVKKNWYLPAPEVFPKTPFEFALLSKQQTDWRTTKLSFEVKGPSHMSLYLLPHRGAALTSWSFGDGTPQFDIGGEYFIFYSHGLDAPAWRFWFEVQAPKSNSGEEMISVGIASHYFFGEDQETPPLMELLHRFPDWSFPSHWVSTYNLYQY
ncbi:ERMP1 metallopeptidase, partial [Polyodon spathula]|nr:endoplasmic reticulum metallopeptidase 1-like [Polyodon spathula]MBN3279846.1 ERMP1 metallopeptidase [Polyodon spathula]